MIKESFRSLEYASSSTKINAGDYFISILGNGDTLRIVDLEGNQAADTLFYSAEDPSVHYSACLLYTSPSPRDRG